MLGLEKALILSMTEVGEVEDGMPGEGSDGAKGQFGGVICRPYATPRDTDEAFDGPERSSSSWAGDTRDKTGMATDIGSFLSNGLDGGSEVPGHCSREGLRLRFCEAPTSYHSFHRLSEAINGIFLELREDSLVGFD